jgi:hypothetical protein
LEQGVGFQEEVGLNILFILNREQNDKATFSVGRGKWVTLLKDCAFLFEELLSIGDEGSQQIFGIVGCELEAVV